MTQPQLIDLLSYSTNQNNTLNVNQTMVNPYTCNIFYVTTELKDDIDPKPADNLAATKLPIPFGQ